MLTSSLTAPQQWNSYCENHSDFFNSIEWLHVLEKSFNSKTVYTWCPDRDFGVAISCFKVGPYRIGYLGFPIGDVVGSGLINQEMVQMLSTTRLPAGVHCIRLPVSAFNSQEELALGYKSTPETAILGLQQWQPENVSKNLRRDIKKAGSSSLKLVDATNSSQGQTVYKIYSDTVKRHRGTLRYSKEYFASLIDLSVSQQNLRCLLAVLDNEVAGFIVTCIHKNTAYYLHGGTNYALRSYNPSDLLLNEAITWARNNGADCFNLMSSSDRQSTLIRYKEKWGGETRLHKTYFLPLRPVTCWSFRIAEKVYALIH